ncbi:neuropeptides capa receptor-like [Genypterus blacodes]|uniref:neuropeptides capa receptor-like n=1 Tax=Genypterus blacodes TaxID=154954 RepID=UPI003F759C98
MDTHSLWNDTNSPGELLHADTMFLLFNCVVLTFTFVLGLPGNLLVCWIVFRNKSLQTCNNALLFNLAAGDLLKCSVDTPLLLFSFLRSWRDSRMSSAPLCALQQFTYALCSCVQLLTLVSISVERYQAIAFPFHTEGRKTRIRLWLLSIWACGLVLGAVSLTLPDEALFYMLCRQHVRGQHPGYVDPFGTYVLVPVWCVSLTVIVIHYVRIFKVVREHRKKVFDRGIQLRSTAAGSGWCWHSVRVSAILVREAGATPMRPPEIVGAVCLLTPGAKERGKKQMEGKVAQRFGYIIIAFTLLWVPMVITLLINAISDTDKLRLDLETSAMVLTCMQAAVDPLIYTVVTRQFRSEFSKIISSIPGCPLKLRV